MTFILLALAPWALIKPPETVMISRQGYACLGRLVLPKVTKASTLMPCPCCYCWHFYKNHLDVCDHCFHHQLYFKTLQRKRLPFLQLCVYQCQWRNSNPYELCVLPLCYHGTTPEKATLKWRLFMESQMLQSGDFCHADIKP